MNANDAYILIQKMAETKKVGIKGATVDGNKIRVEFADGTTEEVSMRRPSDGRALTGVTLLEDGRLQMKTSGGWSITTANAVPAVRNIGSLTTLIADGLDGAAPEGLSGPVNTNGVYAEGMGLVSVNVTAKLSGTLRAMSSELLDGIQVKPDEKVIVYAGEKIAWVINTDGNIWLVNITKEDIQLEGAPLCMAVTFQVRKKVEA